MEKVNELDFKGEAVAPDAGQSEKTEAQEEKVETETKEVKEETEDVESLPSWAKEKLKKLESDKENYKQGMLKYKERTLEPKKEEKKEEEEEYPEWDEASKKFQQQTLLEAEKRAEAKAQATIEKTNEKVAIDSFIEKHPELSDEEKWNDVISNYHPKSGKNSMNSIMKDLETAYVVTRYEAGELDKLQEEAVNKKIAQKKLDEMNTVSKDSSKATPQGSSVSKSAVELAKNFRIDPKELADEPATEIKF